jgi:hypothetical protein
MALDLTTLTPQEWSTYLRIGRQYSKAPLQANATLEALDTHAAGLVDHGFTAEEAQALVDARDLRITAGVGRTEKLGEKTLSSKTYAAAVDEGKSTRLQARSVVSSTLVVLRKQGEEDAARALDVVLGQTRVAPKDPEKLAIQLDLLAAALADPKAAKAAKARGGPAAKVRLANAAPALRDAQKERQGKGTPYTTEQIHVINGIIVTLARQANAAARAAARALKKPTLAKAFALAQLYTKKPSAKDSAKAKVEILAPAAPAEASKSEIPASTPES